MNKMSTLIFDIETIGEDFDSLDKTSQHMLTRWIEQEYLDEDERRTRIENLKDQLGFSPLTGSIVAIGALNAEKNEGAVYFSGPQKNVEFEDGGIKYKSMSEKEMLEQFWTLAKLHSHFVTFNGRSFDVPFMMVRSAVHGVKPTRDLMEGRYLYQQRGVKHIDLFDQLSFYGAARYRGQSLHLWCRALGITSPKAGGVDGDAVADLYTKGEFEKIARYNAEDLRATRELYEIWKRQFTY